MELKQDDHQWWKHMWSILEVEEADQLKTNKLDHVFDSPQLPWSAKLATMTTNWANGAQSLVLAHIHVGFWLRHGESIPMEDLCKEHLLFSNPEEKRWLLLLQVLCLCRKSVVVDDDENWQRHQQLAKFQTRCKCLWKLKDWEKHHCENDAELLPSLCCAVFCCPVFVPRCCCPSLAFALLFLSFSYKKYCQWKTQPKYAKTKPQIPDLGCKNCEKSKQDHSIHMDTTKQNQNPNNRLIKNESIFDQFSATKCGHYKLHI